jgi:two-component system sporulation sensor kinase A
MSSLGTETRFVLRSLGGSLGPAEIAFEDLIEQTLDGVVLIDPHDVIRYWNRGAEAMFQYSREEVLGRRVGFLVPADLLEAGELEWIRGRIDADGSLANFVTRRIRKDGSVRWVSLTRSVLHDTTGRVVGSAAVFRDVTEERRIREELARASGLAIVGEMSVTLAHEIKNRLTGIYAAIQVLSRGLAAGDERGSVFEEIGHEIKRLDETALDLLRYARPAPLERAPTELRAWLEATLDSLSNLPEVRRHRVELDAPEGLVIPIDVELMSQVVNQLVLNAAQAMERAGRIQISARQVPFGAEITVADTGEGIPEGRLEAVFQPFYTTKCQGTGLGLSIARKNVRAHGGSIEVESEAGAGSRFRIRLPASPTGGIRAGAA